MLNLIMIQKRSKNAINKDAANKTVIQMDPIISLTLTDRPSRSCMSLISLSVGYTRNIQLFKFN